jgi:branched-chain amino acid transport system substrate-binding protein
VINVRASYFQETETMVERLTKDRGATRIAILYQDDAFGRAGLAGVQKAMEKRNMKLVAEGTFERNTVAVKQALLEIRKGNPEAVVMVGPYKPCAEFIKLARQVKMDAQFINISFVGSNALAKELGGAGGGVVITQVVPFPEDASIPLVAGYQAALKATDPNAKPGFVTLEGYLVGKLTIAALQKISGEPTRKAFLETILANSFDFGGVKLSYGASDNQGSDDVFLTMIQADGSFKAITSLSQAGG